MKLFSRETAACFDGYFLTEHTDEFGTVSSRSYALVGLFSRIVLEMN